MKRNTTLALLSLLLISYSCEKKEKIESHIETEKTLQSSVIDQKLSFAKIISKAILENKEVRSFLKTEALKTKDNDYDIIYAFCKNDIVSNNTTFKEILAKYEEYNGQLNDIESAIPTITILVPTLAENDFDPYLWDTDSENIFVSSEKNSEEISIIYNGEEITLLKNNQIPASPTLYVKENERIRIKTPMLKSASTSPQTNSSFEFVNEAYNGLTKTNQLTKVSRSGSRRGNDSGSGSTIPQGGQTTINYNAFDFEISPKLVSAFQEFPTGQGGWQRDYIYYDLRDIPNPKGTLDRNYSETLSAIKITEAGLYLMMDQNDPRYNQQDNFTDGQNNRSSRSPGKFWTDGKFEIQVDVLINDLAGAGPAFSIIIPVSGDQLFHAEFSQTSTGGGRNVRYPAPPAFYTRTLTKMVPKFFYCNYPIKEWDLEKMGASWKISVRENDAKEVYTSSETITSKYATNFGADIGIEPKTGIFKFGLKFGASKEETNTQQTSVQRTLDNDFLGDAILNFWDPILKTNTPGKAGWLLVDLRSHSRRSSAINYVNYMDYYLAGTTNAPNYTAEQQAIISTSQNRYPLSNFYTVGNNNFEIIILPTYKY